MPRRVPAVLASTALAFAGTALSDSTAFADVLVSAPSRTLVCGDAIHVGIWAQPGTRGSRVVRITARDRRTGRVWWRRTATARTSRWRDWYLPSGMGGQCRTTIITYKTARF